MAESFDEDLLFDEDDEPDFGDEVVVEEREVRESIEPAQSALSQLQQ